MNQIPSEFILAFLGMVFAAVFLLSQGLVVPVFGEAGRVRKRIRGRLQVLEHASNLPNMQTILRQKYLRRLSPLEALTRDGWLPRGAGAPGLAWQKGETVCIADIAQSKRFLRQEAALALGIDRALADPALASRIDHHFADQNAGAVLEAQRGAARQGGPACELLHVERR